MVEERADVVVVGAGPAGLAAAVRAAETGCSTLLVDEAEHAGGQIWRHSILAPAPRSARAWLRRLERARVRVLTSTTVFDATSPKLLHAASAGAYIQLRADRAVILASGARELFLPFPGWTLPGVMGVGALQALIKSGLNVGSRTVVIAGSGPLLLPVAAAATRAGARVALVAEQADPAAVRAFKRSLWRAPARLAAAARYRAAFAGTPYLTGQWVRRALGTDNVSEVVITDGVTERTIPCDLLSIGYGLVPATELARLLGCTITHGAVAVHDVQQTDVAGVFCAGELTGIAGVDAAIVEGQIAGLAATGNMSEARSLFGARRAHTAFARQLARTFELRNELRALADDDTIICRCEDVVLRDIVPYSDVRTAKLQARVGMGPCQGRVCGPALQHLFGWSSDTVRPPLWPVSVDVLAAYGAESAPAPPRTAPTADAASVRQGVQPPPPSTRTAHPAAARARQDAHPSRGGVRHTARPSAPAAPRTGTASAPAAADTGTTSAPAALDTGTESAPVAPDTGTASAPAAPYTGSASAPAAPHTASPSAPAAPHTASPSAPIAPDTGTALAPAAPDATKPTERK